MHMCVQVHVYECFCFDKRNLFPASPFMYTNAIQQSPYDLSLTRFSRMQYGIPSRATSDNSLEAVF